MFGLTVQIKDAPFFKKKLFKNSILIHNLFCLLWNAVGQKLIVDQATYKYSINCSIKTYCSENDGFKFICQKKFKMQY